VRDRVVQKALVNVIEPILDHTFHDRSFGFRHGRSCRDALRIVEQKLSDGNVWVVDADLKGFSSRSNAGSVEGAGKYFRAAARTTRPRRFDSIPKDRLLKLVKESISDSRVLSLIGQFLDQSILEELREWTPETGVPQGAVLSPVLSNVYLNPLDHLMDEDGFEMVRYADDRRGRVVGSRRPAKLLKNSSDRLAEMFHPWWVILCRSEFEAEVALEVVREWVEQAGLTLHPTKSKIVDSRVESFQFLGYSFRGEQIHPRSGSLNKLKDTIRKKSPRNSGIPLEFTISSLNASLRGWFGYFRHARWPVFKDVDGMVRRRLRRLLKKRHRRNPQRLPATQRWSNAFFAEQGLFSLREAHFRFAQSRAGPD